jgi:hypothetical protein
MPMKRSRRHGGATAEPRWAVHSEWDGDERFGSEASLAMPMKRSRRHGGATAEPRWVVHSEWDGDERFGCKIAL